MFSHFRTGAGPLALLAGLALLPACGNNGGNSDAGTSPPRDASTMRSDAGDAGPSTGRDGGSMTGSCPDLNGLWETRTLEGMCDASLADVVIMHDLDSCEGTFASMGAAGRSVNGIARFSADGSFDGMALTIGNTAAFSCSGTYMTSVDPPRYVVECGACRAELVRYPPMP